MIWLRFDCGFHQITILSSFDWIHRILIGNFKWFWHYNTNFVCMTYSRQSQFHALFVIFLQCVFFSHSFSLYFISSPFLPRSIQISEPIQKRNESILRNLRKQFAHHIDTSYILYTHAHTQGDRGELLPIYTARFVIASSKWYISTSTALITHIQIIRITHNHT